jgi:hypothetical protein
MSKFDKIAVLNKIGSTGMVPVFYHKDAEVAKKVVKACYDGGVRAFEFTNRGDFAHEVFAEVVKFAAKECPEMAMGVGSIVTSLYNFLCNFCILMIKDGHHSGRTNLIQYCDFIKFTHLFIYYLQCTMYNLPCGLLVQCLIVILLNILYLPLYIILYHLLYHA